MENTVEKKSGKSLFTVKEMAFMAMLAGLMAVCSWISVPTTVPFTLQTFGVFCAIGILGGKRAFFSILTFILLGAVGLPVFAGFTGGMGIIVGSTGGYMVGFLLSALIYMLITAKFGDGLIPMVFSMVLGLFVLYVFGTVWFMAVYTHNTGSIGLMTALSWCVFPFVVPDLVKMAVAVLLVKRVGKYVRL